MDSLPVEIIQEIGFNLDKDDILSCNLVCRFWRNSLNINEIWSNFCFKDYLINPNDISILDLSKSCVDPKFEYPKNECDGSLYDICSSRVRYMQEVHISRNWENSNFVSEVVTEEEGQDLERMESHDLLCDNDSLVVYFYRKRLFRVWKLDTPTTELNSIICSLSDCYVKYYKLYKGVLVFVQSNLLQVFVRQIDYNFQMKFRFLITESLDESSGIPDSPDITYWYQQNHKDKEFVTFDHNEKYFVAANIDNINFINKSNKAFFHIWDISKGEKIVESYTTNDKSIIAIVTNLVNDKIFIRLNFMEIIQIISYDLNSQSFTNLQLCLTFNNFVIFTENLIINLDKTMASVLFWNSSDGKFIKSITCDYRHAMQYLHPYIICFSRSKGCTVQIIDTKRLKTVGNFLFNKEIDSLDFIRPNKLLVRIWKWDSYTELWNFRNRCKLHTFFYPADCVVNSSRTKMIVLDKRGICIINPHLSTNKIQRQNRELNTAMMENSLNERTIQQKMVELDWISRGRCMAILKRMMLAPNSVQLNWRHAMNDIFLYF